MRQQATTHQPKISVVIPTLNAAGVLGHCLRAIRAQEYPQAQVEIIIADGGSVDATRQIAAQYAAVVVENPLRVAEQGKRIALQHVSGSYLVFIDADNEIATADFFRLAVAALESHPQVLGLESYYPAAPSMSSFCHYLTKTLHISDPVSWIMSAPPRLLAREGEVERWTFARESLAFPLGANGFVYRREVLESVQAEADFEDTRVALQIALSGRREWLRLSGRGVHHYVVKSVWDFVRKRRRQTYHFLSLRSKRQISWTQMKPRVSPLVACLYCATVIGPIYHTVTGIIRTRDWHWLWHPVASLASVVGLGWGVVTYALSGRGFESEAKLQPPQKSQE